MDSKSTSSTKPATAFSCVRCAERKVKCDRQQPCAACEKHGTECNYRVPPPPRRRKRPIREELLNERLRRYEQALQQQGIDPNEVAPQAEIARTVDRRDNEEVVSQSKDHVSTDRKYASSQLIYNSGRARYVENNLWNRVTEEFGTLHDALDSLSGSEDDAESPSDANIDYILAWTPASPAPRSYHPAPEQVFVLWQIFLENVNPLCKLVHYPTLQVTIEQATTNLDKVPKSLEALMFAIYAAAVLSLRDQDCEYRFAENKSVLLTRYRNATKLALSRAKFMGTSDIVVVQALTLHLLTMRDAYDSQTLWVLTGVAVRIAESLGLHKDGSVLGLPFFEAEMRRRIFWQLGMLDYRSAELSGSAKFRSMFHEDFRVQMPLNLNDSQLYPGMKDPPATQVGVTEMVFCSLRYHFVRFWTRKQEERVRQGTQDEHLWANYTSISAIADKDKDIDELQKMIQDVCVRYCDPTEPVQLMTSVVASVAISTMRLIAHHPRRYSREEDIPESEKQFLWTTSLKLLEGDNMIYTDRKLQRFIWHTASYFQWQAMIHVLDCLRAQPLMPEANKAWQLIDEVYDNHPDFVTDTRKPIHVAVGTLCLKAFTVREEAHAAQVASRRLNPPGYILKLRQQREAAKAKQAEHVVVAKLQAQHLDRSDSSNTGTNSSSTEQQPQRQQHVQPQQSNSPHANTSAASTPFDPTNPFLSFDTNTTGFLFDPAVTVSSMPRYLNPWFDNFGYQDLSNAQNSGIDFMLPQGGNTMDTNVNMIDWNQWDTVIPESTQRN